MHDPAANKVTSIAEASNRKDSAKVGDSAPAAMPLQLLQDRAKQLLVQLLQGMFESADDALFEMADKAQSNSEQNIYFESMRDVRIKRRTIETAFAEAIPQSFNDISANPAVSDSELPLLQAKPGALSLIQNDELEEQVAIDGIVSRILSLDSDNLRELSRRIDSLVPATDVDENSNPLGPRVICNGFIKSCECLEVDIKSRLVVYKLFEKELLKELPAVLEECNTLLLEAGVLPGLVLGTATAAKAANSKMTSANVGAQAMASQHNSNHAGFEAGNDATVNAEQVFASVQHLLAQRQSQILGQGLLKSASWFTPGNSPELPREQIFELLKQTQLQQAAGLTSEAGVKPVNNQLVDVHSALRSMLNEQNVQEKRSLGQVDFDAINLVSMLFQFILDDDNLDAQMKALIGRLQIPLLKAAMLDKSFFGTEGHPARKLLNQMATAALGWVPGLNKDDDPLLMKIQQTVETLLNDYERDTSIFDTLLTEFELFLSQEQKRASLLEKRAVDAADGKAKALLAREAVQQSLDLVTAGNTVPEVVERLLREAWSNVLFLAFLKHGEDSNPWQQALATARDLVWSSADNVPDRERVKLLKIMPDLLKRLREGLTQVSFDPFKMNGLFSDLEKVHLGLLSNSAGASNLADPTETEEIASDAVQKANEADDNSKSAVCDGSIEHEEDLEEFADLLELDQLMESVEAQLDDEFSIDSEETITPELEAEKIASESVNSVSDSESELPAESETLMVDSEFVGRAKAIGIGHWIEVRPNEQSRFRAKLVAITPPNQDYIFVNRAGMKVLELSVTALALQLQEDTIRSLDDGALFDRALQSVIGDLRTIKKPVA
ncbi:MAG: DUF1631 domain-containing protein [Pseudomonadales bacterium]